MHTLANLLPWAGWSGRETAEPSPSNVKNSTVSRTSPRSNAGVEALDAARRLSVTPKKALVTNKRNAERLVLL